MRPATKIAQTRGSLLYKSTNTVRQLFTTDEFPTLDDVAIYARSLPDFQGLITVNGHVPDLILAPETMEDMPVYASSGFKNEKGFK